MQECLLNTLNHSLRISKRAYVETRELLTHIAPLRFKSAKFNVSEAVYSLVLRFHSLPRSVIPKISTNSVYE